MSETVSDVLSRSQRELVSRFAEGDQLALARCISQVEDRAPGFEALLDALHDGVGSAHRIGITGPPGAGKSTLTASIARDLRDRGHRVGVIAVDPSSPFTGGALLGDRVRMDELATEKDIFIRSMASRGAHGGLAAMTREAVDVMDAFGFDRIIIETVGVGQSELEIASSADTTVVVLVPESGDAIQAMKAGLMEVADVFVVNKADRAGADMLRKEIQVARALASAGSGGASGAGHHGVDISSIGRSRIGSRATEEPAATAAPETVSDSGWSEPILKTVATTGEGLPELVEQIERHHEWLAESGTLESRRRNSWMEQVREVLARATASRADDVWRRWAAELASNGAEPDASPYEVGWRLFADLQASYETDAE
ncbi:MAG: methylmalonyl Co-A mutase-associated GTPase MeaB [Gemmatimonadota bacterium]